ncbi:MAG TPA: nuclear transport factor 2 family protein [Thermoanaerobaculia bacterium]|nr:nuclear transport factor 2 family protein [Thermoanaerobaculia bacterium]
MCKLVWLLTACLISLSVAAGPAEEEVRDAETQFAKAFADRDSNRFSAMLASDATFIVQGKGVTGAEAIVKAWSPFLTPAEAPFSWRAEQAFIDASGTLGMSIGGVFDPAGRRMATFTSFWRKENGAWKVVFDGPGAPACGEKK